MKNYESLSVYHKEHKAHEGKIRKILFFIPSIYLFVYFAVEQNNNYELSFINYETFEIMKNHFRRYYE